MDPRNGDHAPNALERRSRSGNDICGRTGKLFELTEPKDFSAGTLRAKMKGIKRRLCMRMWNAKNLPCGLLLIPPAALLFAGCGTGKVDASTVTARSVSVPNVRVAVTKVERRSLAEKLKISSELIPYQEIDIYAKESGYIKTLNVDYGSHVKQGDVMAVLEIPELEAQIQQDEAAITATSDLVTHATRELDRVKRQHEPVHANYERLVGVVKEHPGLVAQQEIDDYQGKDLALESQIEAAQAKIDTAQSQLVQAKAKLTHDQALFAYSNITAPFSGVVTQRYANFGALLQAGTGSSTQAMPLVRLSQVNLYRLAIPVPESAVQTIHVGEKIQVEVPSLNRTFTGTVSRFSFDVHEDTRTMHTEVDVPNPDGVLVPGAYAEATITIGHKDNTLAVPLQALTQTPVGMSVDVVTAGGEIDEREVKIGMQTDRFAEVISGLQEGDLAVISDRSALRQGQAVTPQVKEVLEYSDK
jgi:RND family efflux transporter MFP subunit